MTCAVLSKDPSAASTRTATTFVDGAMPTGAIVPLPVTIPATFVPCPLSSRAAPAPDLSVQAVRTVASARRAVLGHQRVGEVGVVLLHPGVQDSDRHAVPV